MRSRLPDDIEEFGHETEEVDSGVGKRANISEWLNLSLS